MSSSFCTFTSISNVSNCTGLFYPLEELSAGNGNLYGYVGQNIFLFQALNHRLTFNSSYFQAPSSLYCQVAFTDMSTGAPMLITQDYSLNVVNSAPSTLNYEYPFASLSVFPGMEINYPWGVTNFIANFPLALFPGLNDSQFYVDFTNQISIQIAGSTGKEIPTVGATASQSIFLGEYAVMSQVLNDGSFILQVYACNPILIFNQANCQIFASGGPFDPSYNITRTKLLSNYLVILLANPTTVNVAYIDIILRPNLLLSVTFPSSLSFDVECSQNGVLYSLNSTDQRSFSINVINQNTSSEIIRYYPPNPNYLILCSNLYIENYVYARFILNNTQNQSPPGSYKFSISKSIAQPLIVNYTGDVYAGGNYACSTNSSDIFVSSQSGNTILVYNYITRTVRAVVIPPVFFILKLTCSSSKYVGVCMILNGNYLTGVIDVSTMAFKEQSLLGIYPIPNQQTCGGTLNDMNSKVYLNSGNNSYVLNNLNPNIKILAGVDSTVSNLTLNISNWSTSMNRTTSLASTDSGIAINKVTVDSSTKEIDLQSVISGNIFSIQFMNNTYDTTQISVRNRMTFISDTQISPQPGTVFFVRGNVYGSFYVLSYSGLTCSFLINDSQQNQFTISLPLRSVIDSLLYQNTGSNLTLAVLQYSEATNMYELGVYLASDSQIALYQSFSLLSSYNKISTFVNYQNQLFLFAATGNDPRVTEFYLTSIPQSSAPSTTTFKAYNGTLSLHSLPAVNSPYKPVHLHNNAAAGDPVTVPQLPVPADQPGRPLRQQPVRLHIARLRLLAHTDLRLRGDRQSRSAVRLLLRAEQWHYYQLCVLLHC